MTCVGEALVDFTSARKGVSLAEASGFTRGLGGEAANVAVGLARLGTRTAFMGCVGADPFGKFLARELAKASVGTGGLVRRKGYLTRLAFVSLTRTGARDFRFWESKPAAAQLKIQDIALSTVLRSRIVNVGALLFPNNPARASALWIAKRARKGGCDIVFDPNIRLDLWQSPREARKILLRMVRLCTLLRLNRDESWFLTGSRNFRKAADVLLRHGPTVVIITLGREGCFFRTREGSGLVRGFSVRVVDTTGCGDAFLAGVLHRIARARTRISELHPSDLASICSYANAVGALTALSTGAASAMPAAREVEQFMVKVARQ